MNCSVCSVCSGVVVRYPVLFGYRNGRLYRVFQFVDWVLCDKPECLASALAEMEDMGLLSPTTIAWEVSSHAARLQEGDGAARAPDEGAGDSDGVEGQEPPE